MAKWVDLALRVVGHPTVASKEPIIRQYDHTVQGTNALLPYGEDGACGPNDAVVLTPILGRPYGMIISHGINPTLNMLDCYWGGVWAAAEAMSNYVAVGGDPAQVSLIDNFIWPAPDEPSLGDLDRAVTACVDVMHALRLPFISGKDSLSSTYRYPDGSQLKIPPVLCVSAFGRIDDVGYTVTADFKAVDSVLVLVGGRDPTGMGGSVYSEVLGRSGGSPPRVDLEALRETLACIHGAIRSGRVRSCHDVSEGGLLTSAAEMGFGGGVGAEINVGDLGDRPDIALFNETAGVFVVELEDDAAASELFDSVPHLVIGRTIEEQELRFFDGGDRLFAVTLDELRQAWERPMSEVFH